MTANQNDTNKRNANVDWGIIRLALEAYKNVQAQYCKYPNQSVLDDYSMKAALETLPSIQELVRRAGEVDGLSDQAIIDMVAIFNNSSAPKIRCDECNGKGQADIETDDGYPVLCWECEGAGYIQYAVNQAERVKQAREAIRPHLAPVVSGWMDIVSAPRNSKILLFYSPWISCGRWHENAKLNNGETFTGFVGDGGAIIANPTHWMPLPQPPKKD